jgi:TonB family protein
MTATSILALILAAQAAPVPDRPVRLVVPAPPPPAPGLPPRRARANLGSYFSSDDYPAAALRGKEEGMVGFRLVIAANGRVADCAVSRPSGSAALDGATCRIMRSRARYQPARDARGDPTAGTDWGRVVWRLPEDPFDPALEAEASAAGPPVATPKPPRPRLPAGRRMRPRASSK